MSIRVAVLGYGHLGKWHCDKVVACPEAKLVAIVDPLSASQELARQKHPGVLVVSNVRECLSSIDAAFVVTPTSFHFEVVKELLLAKKHVFCEKPLASRESEALELEKLSKDLGTVCQVGHSERCHLIWEKKELWQPFTEKAFLKMERVAPFKGRATDVDVVQDLMIHDIDLLYYLSGEYPISVSSVGEKMRTKHWDFVTSFFDYASGRKAMIQVSRNDVEERRVLTAYNQRGTICVDLFRNKISLAEGKEIKPERFVVEETYDKRDHLLLEHQKFYKAITSSGTPFVSFHEGRMAVRVVDKVLESLQVQGRSIQL